MKRRYESFLKAQRSIFRTTIPEPLVARVTKNNCKRTPYLRYSLQSALCFSCSWFIGCQAPPQQETTSETLSFPPLINCNSPALDRLTEWNASGEGLTQPATGSLLKVDNGLQSAAISFLQPGQWHVFTVWLANKFEASVDLSASKSILIRYAATKPLYMQLRPAFEWSGGNKWLIELPATGKVVTEQLVPLEAAAWTTLPALGKPNYEFSRALSAARGLVFVGNGENKVSVYSLRIEGYKPPCP